MAVCCCSLAGTAACRICSNNPFAETPPPVRTYTVSATDTVLVTGQKTNADRDMRIPSTNRTNTAIGGEKRTLLLIKGIEMLEEEVSVILPGADVRPVVLCKDCKYSYDSVGGWCCSHGICVDCIVREDFFCADGENREET